LFGFYGTPTQFKIYGTKTGRMILVNLGVTKMVYQWAANFNSFPKKFQFILATD
jgi:hypothetical protein